MWKDRDGNKQEETEWHRVIVWAQAAEFCNNYLKRGSKVYVEGRLQTRKWQDQNGNDRYTTEIVAKEIKSLTPSPDVTIPSKKDGKMKKEATPPSKDPFDDDPASTGLFSNKPHYPPRIK